MVIVVWWGEEAVWSGVVGEESYVILLAHGNYLHESDIDNDSDNDSESDESDNNRWLSV